GHPSPVRHNEQARSVPTEQPARARYLVQSIKLEESGPSWVLVASIVVMSLLLFAAIIWAGMTKVNEIAHSAGEVVPAGQIITIQHLEGGIVREIHVSEGLLVEDGQPLITLAAADARAERNRLEVRRSNLLLDAERLRALAEGRGPEFTLIVEGQDGLKADQMGLFLTQRETEQDQANVLTSQIEQRNAELASLRSRLDSLGQEIEIQSEEAGIRKTLLDQGLQSRIVYLDTLRQLAASRGRLAETEAQIASNEAAIVEAEGRLVELKSQLRSENLSRVGEVVAELAEVDELLATAQDRLDRSVIRATAKSRVKGMTVRRPGAVISPSSPIVELVPVGVPLTVQARLNTRDVGHVSVGDPVDLRISTFDYARFGGIDGTVEKISATTFTTQDGAPFYEVVIAMDKDHVGDDPSVNRVSPGMTVDALIITGEKSILDYLMRPVYRGLTVAFTER
ncbi:MAG: HlyD family type I secretion periplasmic adaptor subunit, partial [Pseudomonadota bacterium]